MGDENECHFLIIYTNSRTLVTSAKDSLYFQFFFQVFHACASLLKESYEEVGEVILHKLLSLLNECSELTDSCFDSVAAELVCYFIIYSFL